MIRRDKKGAQITSWLAFGYTTSYRFGQILSHHLDIDPAWYAGDEYEWLVKMFVPGAREALKDNGWMKKEFEREEAGQMVVAVRNRIFTVHSDMSVEEPEDNFAACGSGADEAKGALVALAEIEQAQGEKIAPAVKTAIALRAAHALNSYVRPPYHQFETKLA